MAGDRERVLVAPLHWGLGHAARCIPLIRREQEIGNQVLIAAEAGPRALLQEHFPSLEYLSIPFMEITYPRDGNMVRHFFIRGPRLLWNIWKEHRTLNSIVRQYKIDRVISDNRFGLWNKHCHCIFVTHQVRIKSPSFEGLIDQLNRWVMRHYDEVWIPDHEAYPGLAGELSHPGNLPTNARYIGPLSRFSEPLTPASTPTWKAVALISGPEPQRSRFEADVVRRFIESGEPCLVLEGRPDAPKDVRLDNVRVVNHLDDKALIEALAGAELIIARSGYSTIMDLDALGVSNIEYRPTPGQTEQEYLAELHSSDQS